MSDQQTYTIYFGGELFSTKHLLGNASLAEAIRLKSKGRFDPLLPQALEQRDTTAHAIRDQDIRALLSCDLGLFHYDGPELDSGTVVEFMFAKFADIPSVLLRTDFRGSGDQAAGGEPWNLMTSFFPRTVTVILDAMSMYHAHLNRSPAPAAGGDQPSDVTAAGKMIEQTADAVIEAFEQVLAMPPVLPEKLRESVYRWLSVLPGFALPQEEITAEILKHGLHKAQKGLL